MARTVQGRAENSGITRLPIYQVWANMKSRCYNPKATGYENWGGRGITVCDRWLHSFEAFLEDMGDETINGLSLDRIDVNGNYEPSNCRWATYSEQRINQRPHSKYFPTEYEKSIHLPANYISLENAVWILNQYDKEDPKLLENLDITGLVSLLFRNSGKIVKWNKEEFIIEDGCLDISKLERIQKE